MFLLGICLDRLLEQTNPDITNFHVTLAEKESADIPIHVHQNRGKRPCDGAQDLREYVRQLTRFSASSIVQLECTGHRQLSTVDYHSEPE